MAEKAISIFIDFPETIVIIRKSNTKLSLLSGFYANFFIPLQALLQCKMLSTLDLPSAPSQLMFNVTEKNTSENFQQQPPAQPA